MLQNIQSKKKKKTKMYFYWWQFQQETRAYTLDVCIVN